GAIYESRLGGGTLTYRYLPKTLREVDDHPSVNFLVRKDIFEKVGGFNSSYWPGEDTKLCLDITKLGKKIVYDPDVLVWHHRRRLFLPHLKQVANYAVHRGYFVKTYPQTSLRITYFLPSLLVLGLAGGLALSFFSRALLVAYLIAVAIYFTALLFSALWTTLMRTNILIGLLVIPGIFTTHLTYGVYFIKGLLTRELKR
ncbi:MAG: glycosyltransferase family 2 protein, partial [Actinomycetota bacterium]